MEIGTLVGAIMTGLIALVTGFGKLAERASGNKKTTSDILLATLEALQDENARLRSITAKQEQQIQELQQEMDTLQDEVSELRLAKMRQRKPRGDS